MKTVINKFVNLIIKSDSPFKEIDRTYVTNCILRLIGDGKSNVTDDYLPIDLVKDLVQMAISHGKIKGSITNRNILSAELMDLLTPLPSRINEIFWNKYQLSAKDATKYFYNLSCYDNDIKVRQIAKNISYIANTTFGPLNITINLSKPEKTPEMIVEENKVKEEHKYYPSNLLATENEGYLGRLGYPARSNHRFIRLMVNGMSWGFQFSPYSYFKGHAIFFSQKHIPMKICRQTFLNLFDIIKQFPHYFIGSNADLPIVGGSLLSQSHYQGGHHIFPLMKAKINHPVNFGINGLKAGIVRWPISVIRLISKDSNLIVIEATRILSCWRHYSDESVNLRAETNGIPHHTITPIAYKIDGNYVLDIALRDNQTSKQYPNGIFSSHKDVQHINKDTVGLMEIMGQAILPPRLRPEMEEVAKYLLGKSNKIASYHKPWADQLKRKYHHISSHNVRNILRKEIGNVFLKILQDASVYKWDQKGQKAFDKFIKAVKSNK